METRFNYIPMKLSSLLLSLITGTNEKVFYRSKKGLHTHTHMIN